MKLNINPVFILFAVMITFFAYIPVHGTDKHVDAEKPLITQKTNDQHIKTIVYYFHGNMRCRTCKTIEALTREAVESGFSEAIKEGSVELRIINVDKSENGHFVKDYQLVTRSVVVSKLKSGIEKNWKRLDRVWELVNRDDKFITYIQDEIKTLIKGEG